jgi:hypothetical protein
LNAPAERVYRGWYVGGSGSGTGLRWELRDGDKARRLLAAVEQRPSFMLLDHLVVRGRALKAALQPFRGDGRWSAARGW